MQTTCATYRDREADRRWHACSLQTRSKVMTYSIRLSHRCLSNPKDEQD
uniref:Uncharacterized protein n=1 Tax=Rhizophora mucronata TaxID=61149 RepID=A0A2P2MYN6_RHIMU